MNLLLYFPEMFIGWVYLWLRYRNKERVKEALDRDYSGTYQSVGRVLLALTLVLIFATSILLLVLVALFTGIKNLIEGKPIP